MTNDRTDEAAPVISDESAFATAPRAVFEPTPHRGDDRNSTVWGLGAAAAIVIALWLMALSLSQATSRQVAGPVAEQGIAVLTGIDGLLALHLDEVRTSAEAATDDTMQIALPGYPIDDVGWLPVEARTASEATLRRSLLNRSADLVYVEGTAVFAEGGDTFDGGIFSTGSAVRRVLDTLSQSNHDRVSRFVLPLALIALVLSVVLGILGSGFTRFSVLGTTLVVAALPAIALGALLRAGVALAGSDGTTLAEEFSASAAAVAWLPARVGIIVLLVGLAILVPAVLLHALFDRSIGRGTGELSELSQ